MRSFSARLAGRQSIDSKTGHFLARRLRLPGLLRSTERDAGKPVNWVCQSRSKNLRRGPTRRSRLSVVPTRKNRHSPNMSIRRREMCERHQYQIPTAIRNPKRSPGEKGPGCFGGRHCYVCGGKITQLECPALQLARAYYPAKRGVPLSTGKRGHSSRTGARCGITWWAFSLPRNGRARPITTSRKFLARCLTVAGRYPLETGFPAAASLARKEQVDLLCQILCSVAMRTKHRLQAALGAAAALEL